MSHFPRMIAGDESQDNAVWARRGRAARAIVALVLRSRSALALVTTFTPAAFAALVLTAPTPARAADTPAPDATSAPATSAPATAAPVVTADASGNSVIAYPASFFAAMGLDTA